MILLQVKKQKIIQYQINLLTKNLLLTIHLIIKKRDILKLKNILLKVILEYKKRMKIKNFLKKIIIQN